MAEPVYKRYPLVFYQEDKQLFDAIEKASKASRSSLRATILNAIEASLGSCESHIGGRDSTVSESGVLGDW